MTETYKINNDIYPPITEKFYIKRKYAQREKFSRNL